MYHKERATIPLKLLLTKKLDDDVRRLVPRGDRSYFFRQALANALDGVKAERRESAKKKADG